ncbi:CEP57 protein, partial [Polypterus senegalus]
MLLPAAPFTLSGLRSARTGSPLAALPAAHREGTGQPCVVGGQWNRLPPRAAQGPLHCAGSEIAPLQPPSSHHLQCPQAKDDEAAITEAHVLQLRPVHKSEHHDLAKQIQAASSEQMRQDLERDLESLVKRMESKGDQIAKVHRHQQQLAKLKAASRKQTKLAQDCMETKVAKCSKRSSSRERGRATRAKSCTRGNESLRLLRDMQTLQNSLRKDDVCWDY